MARSVAVSIFLAGDKKARETMLADRFLPILDADPELAAAIMNALPSPEARMAFSVLIEEFRAAAARTQCQKV